MIFAMSMIGFIIVLALIILFVVKVASPGLPNTDYVDRYIKKYYDLKKVNVRRYYEKKDTDFEKSGLEILNKNGDRIDVYTFGYSDLISQITVRNKIKERSKNMKEPDRLLSPYDLLLKELKDLKEEFPMLLFHVRTTESGVSARVVVENVLTGEKNEYFKVTLTSDEIKAKIRNLRRDFTRTKYANKEDIV